MNCFRRYELILLGCVCIFTLPYTPYNLRVWSLPFLSPLLLRREEKEVLTEITLNNGCLGSRNDEERSEMRYVVWFALSVNHRIFERILHSRLRPRVCLPERQCVSSPHFYFWAWIWASGIFCFIERLGSPEKQSYVRLSHNQRGRPLRWTIVRFDSCLPKYDLDRIYFRVETCAFLLRTFSFTRKRANQKSFTFWPQFRQDYPPNLSILLSGGKETNKDSPSNGERTGKSPTWKSKRFTFRIVV